MERTEDVFKAEFCPEGANLVVGGESMEINKRVNEGQIINNNDKEEEKKNTNHIRPIQTINTIRSHRPPLHLLHHPPLLLKNSMRKKRILRFF